MNCHLHREMGGTPDALNGPTTASGRRHPVEQVQPIAIHGAEAVNCLRAFAI